MPRAFLIAPEGQCLALSNTTFLGLKLYTKNDQTANPKFHMKNDQTYALTPTVCPSELWVTLYLSKCIKAMRSCWNLKWSRFIHQTPCVTKKLTSSMKSYLLNNWCKAGTFGRASSPLNLCLSTNNLATTPYNHKALTTKRVQVTSTVQKWMCYSEIDNYHDNWHRASIPN